MPSFDLSLHQHPLIGPGFEAITDDPIFDPSVHLALEQPSDTLSLSDLGYGDEIAGTTPSDVAATACFRVLSDEGVAAMYHVCKQLEAFITSNARIARNTRGGVYRSRFLRDFSNSADLAQHLSGIMKTPLIPHAMGHQIAHINYNPLTLGENVDKWHYDTLQVDTVLFVTDPTAVVGGEFQYFKGTREEMAALYKGGEPFPAERIVSPEMPGPGYAVLMQGNYVVHQACGLREAGERITVVNGFSYADPNTPDFTALGQLFHADPTPLASAEYARHVSLRCGRQLSQLVNQPDYLATPVQQARKLAAIRAELDAAITQLEHAEGEEMKHFGDG